MSEEEIKPKKRGRPRKNPEDKVVKKVTKPKTKSKKKKEVKTVESKVGENLFYKLLNNINTEYMDMWDDEIEKIYNPYVIAAMVGNSPDTISVVSKLSEIDNNITKRMHYLYLLHKLPKRKRYNKYPKLPKELTDDIGKIARYYDVSKREALGLFSLHNDDDMEIINKYCDELVDIGYW